MKIYFHFLYCIIFSFIADDRNFQERLSFTKNYSHYSKGENLSLLWTGNPKQKSTIPLFVGSIMKYFQNATEVSR